VRAGFLLGSALFVLRLTSILRGDRMRRREFIGLLSGAAAAGSLAACAQPRGAGVECCEL